MLPKAFESCKCSSEQNQLFAYELAVWGTWECLWARKLVNQNVVKHRFKPYQASQWNHTRNLTQKSYRLRFQTDKHYKLNWFKMKNWFSSASHSLFFVYNHFTYRQIHVVKGCKCQSESRQRNSPSEIAAMYEYIWACKLGSTKLYNLIRTEIATV